MAISRRNFMKAAAGSTLLLAAGTKPGLATSGKDLPPEAVGILYDATLCIGCKSCMVNCKKYNSMSGGALDQGDGSIPYEHVTPEKIYDAPTSLSDKTLSIIKAVENTEDKSLTFVKQHCMHCLHPACASVCPVGAFKKDPRTGVVFYQEDRCIGCRYCQVACPFGIPQFEWSNASPELRKCQLCHHRFAEGKYSACCEFCPTGASIFGPVKELQKEAKRRLALKQGQDYDFPVQTIGSKGVMRRPVSKYINHVYGMDEAGGTQYLMLAGLPFEQLGFNPNITDEVYPELTWAYIKKVPALIGLLLVAGATCHVITKRQNAEKENT